MNQPIPFRQLRFHRLAWRIRGAFWVWRGTHLASPSSDHGKVVLNGERVGGAPSLQRFKGALLVLLWTYRPWSQPSNTTAGAIMSGTALNE